MVAKYADIWHSFGEMETHAERSEILAQRCAEAGRRPEDIERSTSWPGADAAPSYVELGITQFTVGVGGPDYDLTELREAIAWRDDNSAPPLTGLS